MTKAQVAAQCPVCGELRWICSWPAPQTYIATCAKCGHVKELDASLGIGRMEFQRKRKKGQFVDGEE